jgi:hypothetical protein
MNEQDVSNVKAKYTINFFILTIQIDCEFSHFQADGQMDE